MIKNGKIFDGSSTVRIADSLKGAFAEMNSKRLRVLDANTIATGGMFLEQQLQEILPEILNQVYPEMPLLKFMPVDNSGALSQSIIQRAQSFEGRHVARHETSKLSGTITVNRTAREQIVMEFEAGSEYSDTDLQRAAMLGENIDSSLIEGHHISFMTLVDEIGFTGITLENGQRLTDGLANYSGVISALRIDANDNFENMTGLEIYEAIKLLFNKMVGAAGGAAELRPNVMVLPPKQFSDITTKMMTGTSPVMSGDYTVAQFVEKNFGLKIYASNRFIGQGNGTTDRLAMFNNDRRNMRLHLPQPLNFAPISIRGFHYDLQSKFRIAGIGFNRANAIGYLDAI